MIALDQVVGIRGEIARAVDDGQVCDVMIDGVMTFAPISRFDAEATIEHTCQRIETGSGAVAIVSNVALVWPETGGYRNVQRLGFDRIRVLIDGELHWEPAWATPAGIHRVAALHVPDGMIAVGQSPTHRILFTGDTNAAPSSNR
jgi:hypothetical protein